VDHASIGAGGEIATAAWNWIGNVLDEPSEIILINRDDTPEISMETGHVVNLPRTELP
jgi:hypothetical protein